MVACSCQAGNTRHVVHDLHTIKRHPCLRGRPGLWPAQVGCVCWPWFHLAQKEVVSVQVGSSRVWICWLCSFDFPAAWPSHVCTSSSTTATTRRSRPSRADTALLPQSGLKQPDPWQTCRFFATGSPLGPKGLLARSHPQQTLPQCARAKREPTKNHQTRGQFKARRTDWDATNGTRGGF